MEIRFLDGTEFTALHHSFLKAFSDYRLPMNLTEEQLWEMFTRRGADLSISPGAFVDGNLVGFTFNAVDRHRDVMTVYDVGSGVVPDYRRRGVASSILKFSLPKLKATGAKRYLLEVFQQNSAAIGLYEKNGFRVVRNFEAFRRQVAPTFVSHPRYHTRIIEPDWECFARIWDWEPSWQNSIHSVQRSRSAKTVLGVFSENTCIGYGIVYPDSGDVPQFCIDPAFRRMGAGTMLMGALQACVDPKIQLRAVTIDSSSTSTIRFLLSQGFENLISQHEMEMEL